MSAALFEVAEYKSSAEAVLRSWELLKASPEAKLDLVARLSTRLAKCLSHGFLGGKITKEFIDTNEPAIMTLMINSMEHASAVSASATAELVKAWTLWDTIDKDDPTSRTHAVEEAMKRLLALPQTRKNE